ncbi:hypothetical protein AYL99_02878 [Fonsecaea erecta]|uniref:C2H2-type domain-containing protein n=1 Tax=Fonsecaea erecta TaxID=1367422 RepID=A0A178ZW22_9EURO|nr:hypothetical protein AYL99_02878 [Fonsecaea erecta]OAP63651.1 hypothetical protein AYL99_02878 [Fonsecaea erecta]
MVRENQLQVDHDDGTYSCRACDRDFSSSHGALNHSRFAGVHEGEWCERCERLFVSPLARRAHIVDSPRHNICTPCGLDFETSGKLDSHDIDVHNMCLPCKREFDSPQALKSHDVAVHNMCAACGKFFNNTNDLMQHKRSHLPPRLGCLGCNRKFAEFAAMMIHLESSSCNSGIDREDVDSYIFDAWRGVPEFCNGWTDDFMYHCPGCETDFRYASALCQHLASNACNQEPQRIFDDIRECIGSHL